MQMWTNVHQAVRCVMRSQHVVIHRAATTALVMLDTPALELSALVCIYVLYRNELFVYYFQA